LLTIKDLQGNEEPLVGFKSLGRNRRINGERVLRFLLFPMPENEYSFNMAQEESLLEFDGDEYRIKKVFRKNKGKTYYKEIIAFQTIYDLIDSHQYNVYNGSMTFDAVMNFIFSGTSYTYSAVDTFYAEDWENFGDENRLSILQKALERYEAEFELSGTHLTFKKRIGKRGDFQFRYGYNIKTYDEEVDTSSLSTYIEGYGKDNLKVTYTSPNADKFGIRHAKPVRDERYTTTDGLLDRLKAEIKDSPDVSVTIDFVDMRRAGFAYDVPNEGDDVFLIYEPMDVDLEARIVEVDEEFDHKLRPLKTKVTLSNLRSNIDTAFQKIQKRVNSVIDGNGRVLYNVLPGAIQRSTEALQSAQTELEFRNGIIARSKEDPNDLVLLNSNGVGISRDGGQTFTEAITSEGFVLSAGAIGQLAANNIQIGEATSYESGYDPSSKETPIGAQTKANNAANGVRSDLRMSAPLPTSLTLNQNGITAATSDSSKYARLDYRGLYVHNGAIEVKRPDGYRTIIDGKLNHSFDVFGSQPPFLVDTNIVGRFFETKMTTGGICQIFTFERKARYVKIQVDIGVEVDGNEVTFWLSPTDNQSLWLASVQSTANVVDPSNHWLTLDLGVPDGSEYAIYANIKTNSTLSSAYAKITRIKQTDFL
jgi:phage minor structural protein